MSIATLSPLATTEPSAESVMIDRAEAARLLHLSVVTFDRLRLSGKIGPREIRLTSVPRWNRLEFKAWANLRNPTGELYDSTTWPTIWESLSKAPPVVAV
jgi:hypothetical protein